MKKFILIAALTALALLPALEADAASTKPPSKRSDYSKNQQRLLSEEALKLCRKKLGSQLHFIKVHYTAKKYICYPRPETANRVNYSIPWNNPAFLK